MLMKLIKRFTNDDQVSTKTGTCTNNDIMKPHIKTMLNSIWN